MGIDRICRALDEHHLRCMGALCDVHRDRRTRAREAMEGGLTVSDRSRERHAEPLVEGERGAHDISSIPVADD